MYQDVLDQRLDEEEHEKEIIDFIDDFKNNIDENKLFTHDDKLLLAISGGVDSVVLLHLINHFKYHYSIAHCNFQLRGEDSQKDQWLVQLLSERYLAPSYYKIIDTQSYATKHKLSIEMAARQIRYEWFNELVDRYKFTKIVVAHHKNDNIETLLLNLTRGTGIAGLRGILPIQNNIVRPLLIFSKRQIYNYAQTLQLDWNEDITNTQLDCPRNIIRNKVIDYLNDVNANAINNIQRSMNKVRHIELAMYDYIDILKKNHSYKKDQTLCINTQSFHYKEYFPTIMWEWLKTYGFNFNQIDYFIHHNNENNKPIYSDSHMLYIQDMTWIITPIVRDKIHIHESINYIDDDTSITFDNYNFHFSIKQNHNDYQIFKDKNNISVNYELIKFPIKVRFWENGDKFMPLGMNHYKKISDFLTDLKIPHHIRKNVCVISDRNNEIIWVVGYRIGHQFRIQQSTKDILEITTSKIIVRDIQQSNTFHH